MERLTDEGEVNLIKQNNPKLIGNAAKEYLRLFEIEELLVKYSVYDLDKLEHIISTYYKDTKDVDFDYGIIELHHRLNINKEVNHKVISFSMVIRIGTEMVCDLSGNSWREFQILYKNDDGSSGCAKYNIDEYSLEIKHKGHMQVNI